MSSLGSPESSGARPASSPDANASPVFTFGNKSKTSFNFSSPTVIDQEPSPSAGGPSPSFPLASFPKSPMASGPSPCSCSHGHHHQQQDGTARSSAKKVLVRNKESALQDDLEQELLSSLTDDELQTLMNVLKRAGHEGVLDESDILETEREDEEIARQNAELLGVDPSEWLQRPPPVVMMQQDDDVDDDVDLKMGQADGDEEGETNSLGGFELEGGAVGDVVGPNEEEFDDPFGDDADLDQVIANLTSLRFHGLTAGGPPLDPATAEKQLQQEAAESLSSMMKAVAVESAEGTETSESAVSEEVESWLDKSEEGQQQAGARSGGAAESATGDAMQQS